MNIAKKEIQKEIQKLDKKYLLIMNKFYNTQSHSNIFGDSGIYRKADEVLNEKQLLINALKLIAQYENKPNN